MNERKSFDRASLRGIMRHVASRAMAIAMMAGLMTPALAHAQMVTGGTDPSTILNNIATFVLGPFGESLAVLGVIGVGFAFIIGRASLGLIGSIVGGLVLIFGASFLVTQFVGAG